MVAVSSAGDFVVVWSSFASNDGDTSNRSVQGQRFASDGTALGGQFQVNTYTSGPQFAPAVALTQDGDFVVVWTSYGSANGDTAGYSAKGQRFRSTVFVGDRVWLDSNANGIQDGGENGVADVSVFLYREPDPPFLNAELNAKAATLVDVTMTDVHGFYSFGAPPGTYYLDILCGIEDFTLQDQGPDDALDSDVDPKTRTTTLFNVVANENDGSRDIGLIDPDGDSVFCFDNCPYVANPDQADSDVDKSGDVCDLCTGNDLTGDGDSDGLCADSDCDDTDPLNACAVFSDGFESGDMSMWSSTE